MRHTISSNAHSFHQQVSDALEYLRLNHANAYCQIRRAFHETLQWSGSWLDTDAMGVDAEWPQWLADEIETTELVEWCDGEPFTVE